MSPPPMHAALPLSDRTAEHLVTAIAEGSHVALGELYAREADSVFALGVRITRSRAEAEEILQDVFLELWSCARSYDRTRGTVTSWLALMTRRRAIDRYRSRTAQERRELAACQTDRVVTPSPVDTAIQNETAEHLELAVGRLPGEQQQVLRWAYFEGLTLPEIAARQGAPLGTVKSRMRTALRTLVVALGATG
jgi:RNA polymerase sigma-70 factor (ECF subfamily)